MTPHNPFTGHHLLNRRGFLDHTGTGLSSIALVNDARRAGIAEGGRRKARHRRWSESRFGRDIKPSHPFASRSSHFPAAAKRVVVIFCSGACSHLDTFDYKPELIARHGQPLPGADKLITFQGEQGNVTQSPWKFQPRGESGKMISDLVPHLGALADDMCFLHSIKGKTNTHGPGENYMSTGFTLDGFPSIGAWTTYALGTENENLPAYVAIPDPRGTPQNSVNNWGPGFLPAAYQGTDFNTSLPIRNLARPESIPESADAKTRDFLETAQRSSSRTLPRRHRAGCSDLQL